MGFGAQAAGCVAVGELAKTLVEFGFFDVVGADAEVLEERLVELPAGRGVNQAVGGFELGGEVEHFTEDMLQFLGVALGLGEVVFGLGEVGCEGGLFVGEDVLGERVVEEGIEELGLLGFDLVDAAALAADLGGVVGAHPGDRLVEGGAHVVEVRDPLLLVGGAGLLEFHVGVFGGEFVGGVVGGEVGEFAAGALDASEAGEVGVDPAALAFGFDEGEAVAAARAD